MADVSLLVQPRARESTAALDAHQVGPGEYLLLTAHRAGNVDDPDQLARLVDLLLALPGPVVFPCTRARGRGSRRPGCSTGSTPRPACA